MTTSTFQSTRRYLSPEEAPALYAVVREYAAKLGVRKLYPIVLENNNVPGAWSWWPNNNPRQPHIVLSTRTLELFGGHDQLSTGLSDHMKGIVAHELSHIKDGFHWCIRARKVPIFALPLAAAGAMELYLRSHSSGEVAGKKALEAAGAQAKKELDVVPSDRSPEIQLSKPTGHQIIHFSMLLGAAALGLGAGLLTTRHMSITDEFRAERIAAKLTGNPHAIVESLEMMYQDLKAQCNKEYLVRWKEEYTTTQPTIEKSVNAFWQRLSSDIKKIIQREKQFFDFEILNAHPSPKMVAQDLRKHGFNLAKQQPSVTAYTP